MTIAELAALPDPGAALRDLSDLEAEAILRDWRLWAREGQLEPEGDWRIWLVLAGRGYGKTRVGAEWTREQVKTFEYVNLIGPTAADVRDVMVQGESGILAVCPPWERPHYYPSKRQLKWPNGAKSLLFSAEDPEQLRGPQDQRLWCDELAAWSTHTRQETWDLAMFGLRLDPDPRCLVTTTPKPIALLRDLIEDPNVAITKGSTYDNRANLAPAFFQQLITKYEGTRLGRQELEAELLLDEGLAYRLRDGVHIVPPVPIPPSWHRFEAMDHGTNNPTAWPIFAVDYDGNVLCFDMYYSPGLISDHAAAVMARRRAVWWAKDERGDPTYAPCYAPPDIKTRFGVKRYNGTEVSVESEYAEHGIHFLPAQNDRRAGYARVLEMLKEDEKRRFPAWHPKAGEVGAPRFYVVDFESTKEIVKQLRDAPIEDVESPLSRFPGEAVDMEWESSHGHAHAAVRYGLMSRPLPSVEPKAEPTDPREAATRQMLERFKQRDKNEWTSL